MTDKQPLTPEERLAADLYAAAVQPDTIWWDDLTPEMQEPWRRAARAAERTARVNVDALQQQFEFGREAGVREGILRERAARDGDAPRPLVCCLCLFVGPSAEPAPVTVINGALVCEPHNGYFQGGDHVQALIAWKREHPEAAR